jgi:hypothetical protein
MATMVPQSQAVLSLEVEIADPSATGGVRWFDLGSEFREWGGVGYESESTSVRPGSMAPPEPVASSYTLNELTVSRTLRLGRDSGLIQTLLANKNCPFRGSREPVDAQGRTGLHQPTSISGIVTGAVESDYDVDGSDVATIQLTLQPGNIA